MSKPKWHWTNSPDRDEIRDRISLSKKGKHASPETEFKKGQPNKFKGKHLPWIGHNRPHTEEAKKKMSENRKGKHIGESNNKWKGDLVGNTALHSWVKRQLGFPNECENCKTQEKRMYHWANISREYKRDVKDWIRLCVPCHKRYDLGIIKLKLN